jgi:Ser/Thr protein kinase RdoA (MazF antagonist)
MAHWALGGVSAIRRCVLGTVNDTYVVTASGRRVVLRRHRCTDASIVRREHALMGCVRERGVACPRPIPTPDSRCLVEDGGRLYSLFEHAPGVQVPRNRLTPAHAAALGQALAEIHDAIGDARPVQDGCLSARRGTEHLPAPAVTAAHLHRLLGVVEARSNPTPPDAWAARRLRSRLDWLQAHPEPPPVLRSIERRPIHGDFQESNVFFGSDGSVCSVIDWDTSEYGSRAGELVRTMALCFELDPVKCHAFLDGYRGRRPVETDDLDVEARIYSWKKLHDTWIYDMVYLRADPRPGRFLKAGSYRPFESAWEVLRRSVS